MKVGSDPEMAPRIQIASAACAFLAAPADTTNFVRASGDGGADTDWVRVGCDSVLYTVHYLGIARGGTRNALYGESTHTPVIPGVAYTTGVDSNPAPCLPPRL